MAAGGRSFGISLGVNAAIGTICLLFFCLMRLRRLTRKFYMPRQFMETTDRAGKPHTLPRAFAGWFGPAWKTSEEEIIRVAGYDAAMYVKIISFAFEIFTWVAIWTIIIVLPTNLVGREVSRLTGTNNVPTSEFTYWVPNATSPSGSDDSKSYKAPNFYAKTPPAPAGVSWWKYNAGVPPLPDPASVLGSNYSGYQWKYDSSYQAKSYTFSDLDKVTITNVTPRSHLLWVHAVATWIVAIVVMRATWRYSKDAVQLHIMYLRNASHGAEAHSVVVTDIPGTYAGTVSGFVPEKIRKKVTAGAEKSKIPETLGQGTNFVLPSSVPRRRSSAASTSATPRTTIESVEGGEGGEDLRVSPSPRSAVADLDAWVAACSILNTGSTIEDMVRREYNELYEGDVNAIHLVYQSKDLDPLVEEYQALIRSLEDLIDDYASKMQRDKNFKRQTTRVIGAKYGKWGRENYGGWWPVKTDLLDWYVKRCKELKRLIEEEQHKCSTKPGPTAFVTFKSRRSQTIAANSLQHTDVKSWHVASAPQPDDIIWDNVKLRSWEKGTRFAIIWTLFVVMALFYTIPIGAVQAIIEVDRLKNVPGFKQLVQITFIRSIIEAILPGLVLNIFLLLLPFLLRFMNVQQGMISNSQVDFGLNRKYYIFLIITVFLGSIIGGTLFNQFNQWIDSPSSAVTILGTAAPLTSVFFLTYISLQAFTSLPLSFLRLFGLVIYWIRSKFAATVRAKARVWSEQRYSYGKELPRHMLILFVGIVFSVVNPLVPVMAIVYFTVALLTERYNMLYIYVPVADSGGKIWTEAYAQIVTALFFFELMMIALLAIKKSFAAILVVPLIGITFIFWQACKPVFQKPLSVLALRTAVDMDAEDKAREGEISLENSNRFVRPSATQRRLNTYMQPSMNFNEDRYDNVLREVEDVELALQGKKELDLQRIGETADIEMGHSNPSTDGEDPSPTAPRLASTSQRLLIPDRQMSGRDSASISPADINGQSTSRSHS